MRTSKKVLAVLLTIATIIGIFSCATTVFAEDLNEYTEEKAYQEKLLTETVETEEGASEIVREVPEKRDEYSKTYKRADGSFTSVLSKTPIHKLEDGEWKEINNTLKEVGRTITNTDGAFDVEFPETITENEQITVTNNGESIAFSVNDIGNADGVLEESQTTETDVIKQDLDKTVSQITYEAVDENTDIQYIVAPSYVKENIIVSDKASLKESYSFDIEKGELSAELDSENNLIFKNSENETVFTIPAPVMTDALNTVCYDIEVTVENADKSVLTLSYTPSKEWLESADRAFPIVIDPLITTSYEDEEIIADTFIYYASNDPDAANTNYINSPFGVVADQQPDENGVYGKGYVLVKFNMDAFSALNAPGIAITDANYYLLGYAKGGNILAKEINTAWNPATVTYSQVFPTDDITIEDYCEPGLIDYYTGVSADVEEPDIKALCFNITEQFTQWLTGEKQNNGFALVPENQGVTSAVMLGGYITNGDNKTYVESYCSIDYVDTSGYNDSFEYLTQSIGRAGNADVNTFSRSVSVNRTDLAMDGLRMPADVSFNYVPAFRAFGETIYTVIENLDIGIKNPYLPYGNNWIPSALQFIIMINENRYEFFSGEGTQVSFKLKEETMTETIEGVETTTTTYTFEETETSDSGYTLELIDRAQGVDLDNLKLTNPDGEGVYFNENGLATEIREAEPNSDGTYDKILVQYNQQYPFAIEQITDGIGRKYVFEYDMQKGVLTSVKCLTADGTSVKAGTTDTDLKVTYGYDSNNNLTSVTYPDGEAVTYTYDSNGNLVKIQNIDGYNIQYTYDNTNRITNIAEYAGTTNGNSIHLTQLSNRQVKVDDDFSGTQTYQFGRDGKLLYTFDEKGNYLKTDYAPARDENVYTSNDWRITSENLLKNGSFEDIQSAKALYWSNSFNVEDIQTSESITDYACRVSAVEETTQLQSQTVAVNGGDSYTFSLYAKSNLAETQNTDRLYISISAEDEDGSVTSESRQLTLTENFEQYSVTVSKTGIVSVTVEFGLKNKKGDFYVNNAQLEKGSGTAPFNYIKNGSFNNSYDNWTTATVVDETLNTEPVKAVKLSGGLPQFTVRYGLARTTEDSTEEAILEDHISAITQNVKINGKKGQTFTVGGWFKGEFDDNYSSVRAEGTNYQNALQQLASSSAQIKVTYTYTDTVTATDETTNETTTTEQLITENFVVDFVAHNDGWQYAADTFALKGDTQAVDVTVLAKNVPEDAYVTGISLLQDSDSELIKEDTETEIGDDEETCTCGCADCYYGENCPCTGAINDDCQCPECLREETSTQDNFGNTLSNKSTDGINYIETLNSYTVDGNNTASTTDENGNVVTYDYDVLNGILKSVTSPMGTGDETTTTNYSYDEMSKVVSVSITVSDTENRALQYVYSKDRLSEIITPNGKYRILYDNWGQVTSVNVVTGSGETENVIPLVEYTYNDRANRTQIHTAVYKNSSTNRGEYTYEYYDDGTLKYIYLNEEQIHFVEYNNLGVLTSIQNTGGRTVEYTDAGTFIYNPDGVCIYSTITNDDGTVTEENYGVTYKTFAPESDYDSDTGISTETEKIEINSNNRIKQETQTDYFGRTKSENLSVYNITDESEENPATLVGRINTEYGYSVAEDGKTSSSIEKFINKTYNGSSGNVRVYDGYYYEYDKQNKISAEKTLNADGTTTDKYSYEYDKLGQLVRFNDAVENKTYTYTYDNNGNILTKSEYAYTLSDELGTATNITTYGYDTQWKDKLTTVGDKTIAYDNIGNPTSYLGATLTWEGRQLKSFENDEKLLTYEYDENGMRYRTVAIDKTTEENTTSIIDYVWLGGKLVSMVVTGGDSTNLSAKYLYNSSDEIIGFNWVNGTDAQSTYYYLKNLQGDITGIVNAAGKLEISFNYDVWGKRTTQYHANISLPTGAIDLINQIYISILNPFGYRGYCFDGYTELYYLQSRYYDPNTGRFINGDDTNYLNATGTVLGCNLFAYCENDAVNRVDPRGDSSYYHTANSTKTKKITKVVKSFLKNYLIKNKEIKSIGEVKTDENGLYLVDVKYKKSKNNTNKLRLVLGKYKAWKRGYDALVDENNMYYEYYGNTITNEMVLLGTANTDKFNFINVVGMQIGILYVLHTGGIRSKTIKQKYQTLWGDMSKTPKKNKSIYLINVSKQTDLNGWYSYNTDKHKGGKV